MLVFGIIPRQIDFSIIEGTKKGLENNRPSLLASVVWVSPSPRFLLSNLWFPMHNLFKSSGILTFLLYLFDCFLQAVSEEVFSVFKTNTKRIKRIKRL